MKRIHSLKFSLKLSLTSLRFVLFLRYRGFRAGISHPNDFSCEEGDFQYLLEIGKVDTPLDSNAVLDRLRGMLIHPGGRALVKEDNLV